MRAVDMRDDKFERDARRMARFLVWIIFACVATILIGLSMTVPWLGIPLTILAVIAYFLAG
jgi:fatty acid desaturase